MHPGFTIPVGGYHSSRCYHMCLTSFAPGCVFLTLQSKHMLSLEDSRCSINDSYKGLDPRVVSHPKTGIGFDIQSYM